MSTNIEEQGGKATSFFFFLNCEHDFRLWFCHHADRSEEHGISIGC